MAGLHPVGTNITAPAVNPALAGKAASLHSVVGTATDPTLVKAVGGGTKVAGTSGVGIPGDHRHPFPSRQIPQVVTPVLVSGALWTGTVTLDHQYKLLSVTCSDAARVRLYDRAAKALADQSRPIGQNPTGDHGLMFEFVGSPTLMATCVPKVIGSSNDSPITAAIPVTVTNLSGATQALIVTFTFQSQR